MRIVIPPLPAYYDQLERHNWLYESDPNNEVWRKGKKGHDRICRIYKEGGGRYTRLYIAFRAHALHGDPKPERPNGN